MIRYSLGIYQSVGAVFGLLFMGPSMAEQGLEISVIIILFSSLLFVSGIVLLVHPEIGWKLSVISQGMQVFGVSSPLVTYLFSEGIALRIQLGLIGSEQGILDARFAYSFGIRFGADFAIAAFQSLPGLLTLGIYVNVMAAITTWFSIRGLRRWKRMQAGEERGKPLGVKPTESEPESYELPVESSPPSEDS